MPICRGDPIPSTLIEKVNDYIPEDFRDLLDMFKVDYRSLATFFLISSIFLLLLYSLCPKKSSHFPLCLSKSNIPISIKGKHFSVILKWYKCVKLCP